MNDLPNPLARSNTALERAEDAVTTPVTITYSHKSGVSQTFRTAPRKVSSSLPLARVRATRVTRREPQTASLVVCETSRGFVTADDHQS